MKNLSVILSAAAFFTSPNHSDAVTYFNFLANPASAVTASGTSYQTITFKLGHPQHSGTLTAGGNYWQFGTPVSGTCGSGSTLQAFLYKYANPDYTGWVPASVYFTEISTNDLFSVQSGVLPERVEFSMDTAYYYTLTVACAYFTTNTWSIQASPGGTFSNAYGYANLPPASAFYSGTPSFCLGDSPADCTGLSLNKPVVLIHGYCSDPTTFGQLKLLLEMRGLRVYEFNYYTLTHTGSGPDYSIEEIAYHFGQFVDNILTLEHASRVDVVAHSEGGVVTRSFMVGLKHPTFPLAWPYQGQVARLVTIGTPHYGQPVPLNLPGCSALQAQELAYGSNFVSRLHDRWQEFETGPLGLSNSQLLFIAGTHGTGGSECQPPLLSPYSSLLKGAPCNDGLVDIDSAVLPAASLSANVRYVPYQHCDGNACLLLGTGQGEADISDVSHKTYQAIQPWLQAGIVIDQCCGSNTIDYTPSFFNDPSKHAGFLLLRFRDAGTNLPVDSSRAKVVFMPRINPSIFLGDASLTITQIPAPATYIMLVEVPSYEPAIWQGIIAFNAPTVPGEILLTRRGSGK